MVNAYDKQYLPPYYQVHESTLDIRNLFQRCLLQQSAHAMPEALLHANNPY